MPRVGRKDKEEAEKKATEEAKEEEAKEEAKKEAKKEAEKEAKEEACRQAKEEQALRNPAAVVSRLHQLQLRLHPELKANVAQKVEPASVSPAAKLLALAKQLETSPPVDARSSGAELLAASVGASAAALDRAQSNLREQLESEECTRQAAIEVRSCAAVAARDAARSFLEHVAPATERLIRDRQQLKTLCTEALQVKDLLPACSTMEAVSPPFTALPAVREGPRSPSHALLQSWAVYAAVRAKEIELEQQLARSHGVDELGAWAPANQKIMDSFLAAVAERENAGTALLPHFRAVEAECARVREGVLHVAHGLAAWVSTTSIACLGKMAEQEERLATAQALAAALVARVDRLVKAQVWSWGARGGGTGGVVTIC